ncbi:pentatricopeptide repeat-containing protein At4g21705, mitochondrial-like [Euphorbia lathyris]|uniref:pentatricopeptide repeat-containing protein At4g21705, mitochondrial-like n=1 Tax=Euphorbia lathyris TaxID=212925 RepID=UPI003313B7BD
MASMRFWTSMKRTHMIILKPNAILQRRNYSRNLFSKISPLGHPTISLVPVIDKWVQGGKKIEGPELKAIIKDLRARKRYSQALEVSEWMSSKRRITFSPGDLAMQLDLIGRVHGVECAESYFQNLNDQDKTDKTYGALLNCYVREGLVDKSLHHMKKMKKLGFASSTLTYNDLMCLYYKTGQQEKVINVLSEMKENDISPDNYSYRICMTSCAARDDLSGVEKLLEEIENQPDISLDWLTCSTVANIYITAGLKERALVYLKKCEELVGKNSLGYNHLISLHASLGNKDEMMRIWGLKKAKCKKEFNKDYITMLGSLVNIGELEESKKLLQEWESSALCYDFRVPSVVLIGYCKKGLVEKAEAILRDIEEKKQKRPTPNSWAIIAAGYVDKQNMEKAFQCMKEALTVQTENKGWRPKGCLISSILSWLGDNGNVEDVESFVNLLEAKVPKDREIYHTLIKVYIRGGKQVDRLLESMKADNIHEDEETKTILSLGQKSAE